MTDKDQPNKNQSSFFNNDLITDNYCNLVHDKITKELLNSQSIDSSVSTVLDDGNGNTTRHHYVIAKCKGFLGIHFCENPKNLVLKLNDCIIVKVDKEFEFATVLELGDLANFKKLKQELENETLPIIERTASEYDIEKHLHNLNNAHEAKSIFLKLVEELSLEMKLVDIHYQFDRKKLFFFYTADGRVDFRELAKKLASTFKTRIELRQIGVRDEAKRLGGIATCGREYCCSSFLSNFKRITTDIAIENNISTSISKYTGPCGKLKCCLSFEV
jgi:cell fate regulator YaaT (PSP1 superfamily)